MSNLVGNAVQHGSAGTPVGVTLRATADEVTLAVHNSGPVIPPGQMRQMFSPLKRIARGAPQRHDSGSMGLGLYIANEIVKGHGGRIDVESSEASRSTFTVRLPRNTPTGARQHTVPPRRGTGCACARSHRSSSRDTDVPRVVRFAQT